MATHASALKAYRQSLRRREHNREFRAKLRTALKDIRSALDKKDLSAARQELNKIVSLIDKLAGKGVIHRNAAARYKSRISTRLAKIRAA